MKILIVEDMLHNLNESIEALRKEGHEIEVRTTAKQAIDLLQACAWEERKPFRPDYVLTDMELPFGEAFHSVYEEAGTPTPKEGLVPHAGLVIALKAVGIAKQIAILTDTNHHHGDPVQRLLDAVRFHPGDMLEFPGEKGRRKNSPSEQTIVRVEARNCSLGWINLTTGEKTTKSQESEARSPTSPWRPIKDWAKLARALIEQRAQD